MANITRAFFYRLGIRLRVHPVLMLRAVMPAGPFFQEVAGGRQTHLAPVEIWQDSMSLFGWYSGVLSERGIPDWHANALNGKILTCRDRPWWNIADFDSDLGDIKTLWEVSRFDWVVAIAQRGAAGDVSQVEKLNLWLEHWCCNNPAYLGPNWKCGQEAAIRVMHLAVAALLLRQF
ncbi:MAG: hypothetical protein OEV64_11270, partial [Desulfobulbaceae bacterium]|nr:hypothetical protein [Desulfobulbaceae bacterium]